MPHYAAISRRRRDADDAADEPPTCRRAELSRHYAITPSDARAPTPSAPPLPAAADAADDADAPFISSRRDAPRRREMSEAIERAPRGDDARAELPR